MSVVVSTNDGLRLEVDARAVADVLRAFGFDSFFDVELDVVVGRDGRGIVAAGTREAPTSVASAASETLQAIVVAHHLLGLKDGQFRETGLMLAQRPDTWREFDAARRLGAGTAELQRILLGGLFNEVPK